VNAQPTDAFTAEYFNMNPETVYGNSMGPGIDNINQCEYWTVSMDAGSSQKNVILSWDGTSCGITNLSALRVARFNSALWINEGNLFTTGTTAAGTISSNVTTGFGPFTIATINIVNTLPITLLSFSANYNGKEVKLTWITSTEINNNMFSIERSADGNKFESILTQPGAGNSNKILSYSAEDINPLSNISYYRLKQTDYDGKSTYSDIIPIRIRRDEVEITAVRPARQNSTISFDVNFPFASQGIIKIVDMNGKLAYGSKFSATQPKSFTVDASRLATGIYFLQIYYEDRMVEKKFIY
jgi:hypothetical protein